VPVSGLRNYNRIYIYDFKVFPIEDISNLGQQLKAADAFILGIAIGKMPADVACPGSTQQGGLLWRAPARPRRNGLKVAFL